MSLSLAAEAILKTLKAEMPPLLTPEQIGLCAPGNADMFLLGVYVNTVGRDARAQMNGNIRIDASTAAKAPVNVELRVMVTSYAGEKHGLMDDYRLLERVMQIWHDHGRLPMTSPLQPSHVPSPQLELLSPGPEEITQLWHFPNVPYRLSLFYRVAPVAIPSRTILTRAPVGAVDYTAGDA